MASLPPVLLRPFSKDPGQLKGRNGDGFERSRQVGTTDHLLNGKSFNRLNLIAFLPLITPDSPGDPDSGGARPLPPSTSLHLISGA